MSVERAEVEREVVGALEALGLSGHPVTVETSIEELAIDLPDLVELCDLVRQRWGAELSTADLEGAGTVSEVVDIIVERVSAD